MNQGFHFKQLRFHPKLYSCRLCYNELMKAITLFYMMKNIFVCLYTGFLALLFVDDDPYRWCWRFD